MTTETLAGRPAALADRLWPAADGAAGWARLLVLGLAGACLLTASAKVTVPGPVPMTLQTLAVLALGALLGTRAAVVAVAAYLLEGALGLPVFANTPPVAAGLPYLIGPTGGFLAGFGIAAALVGLGTERGWAGSLVRFTLLLAAADLAMLASGWAWLAFAMPVKAGYGLGAAKAFGLGIQPFLLGEALKIALAAVALPPALRAFARRSDR